MKGIDGRMSRIIGQLRGVQKMVNDNRGCPEILQQISAIKKAIDGLSKEIILIYITDDLPEKKKKEFTKMIEQTINL